MNHIPSYPSVYALGHRAISDILGDSVVVEEKIDGSQFSMSRVSGDLVCRSKGKDLVVAAPEKMFLQAVASAASRDLQEGWVYRCEYLKSPKHNTLAYSRVPTGHLMVFDIMTGPETYLGPAAKANEASRIGLECVPLVYEGVVSGMDQFNAFLDRESILGGCKIEGVVVKNYGKFTTDKKVCVGKYVSEAFKEKHGVEWKKSNPGQSDVVQTLIGQLRTEARWLKSVQHLRDDGRLHDSPSDIGLLIREIQADVEAEEALAVKDALYAHFWPYIQRGVLAGFPEFYKKHLAEKAFEK